jgi:hypothetical protein
MSITTISPLTGYAQEATILVTTESAFNSYEVTAMDGILAVLTTLFVTAAFGLAALGWGHDSRSINPEGDRR